MIDFLTNSLNDLNGLLIGLTIGAIVTGAIVVWNHVLYKKLEDDFDGGIHGEEKKKPKSKEHLEDKKDTVSYPDYYQV